MRSLPGILPAYEHEKHELIDLADDYGIDIDKPFKKLPKSAIETIWRGVPDRDFGGLDGFFAWLERRKYKIQIAVFLNRWKASRVCTECKGSRFHRDVHCVCGR